MSKNQELDKLFDHWEKEIIEYNGFFKRDGIFDETIFAEQKKNRKAILFIAIEGNDPNQKMNSKDDYRTWWKDELRDNSQRRFGCWAYGILNEFPKYEYSVGKENILLGIRSIAFMNLKKSGGISTPNVKEINKLVRKSPAFLHKEINIIDPDIIIGGLFQVPMAWRILFDIKPTDWILTENKIRITTWEGIKIIDFYHPSHRKSDEEIYYLLQKTFESQLFVNL